MSDPDFQSSSPPYDAIAEAIMGGILQHISLDALADTGLNSGLKFLSAALKFLQKYAVEIATDGGRVLSAVEEPFLPIFAAFLTPIVANMFGAHIGGDLFSSKNNVAGRENAARELVDAYIRSLMGDGAGELTPSIEGSRRVASASVHAALEGMFTALVPELVGEMVPWEWMHFKEITKLPEEVLDVLGVNRLVRRALTPLVQTVAATPMQWHVNKIYRPSLLAESMAVKQFLRGKWTRAQLDEEMARNGWNADRIEAFITQGGKMFSPADVRQFESRGFWTHEQAIQHLRDQGYDENSALAALRLQGLAQIEQLETQEANAAISAYAGGDIDRGTFNAVLSRTVLRDVERNLFTELADVRRSVSVKHLAHGEVRDCVKVGILTTAFYRGWLARENYQPDEAFALELLLRHEIDKATAIEEHRRQQDAEHAAEKAARELARQQKQAAIDAERALHRRGSIADLRRAVVRGLIPVSRLAEVLTAEYDADTVGVLVDLVEDDKAANDAQEQRAEEARQRALRRNLDIGALEQAVLAHVLSVEDFHARLRAMGFDEPDAGVLTATLAEKLQDQEAAKRAHDEAQRLAAIKHIDLARAEFLVIRGWYTLADYDRLLQALGFEPGSRAAMVDYLKIRIADYAAALAERQRRAAEADVKGVTLDQMRRGVVLGAVTRQAFQAWLVAQHYTADAQIVLLAELDDDVDQADAARRRREEAERRRGQPAIPLSTLARAVQLGLVPVATYEARLVKDGYTPEDIAIERALLVTEIADVRAAQQRRDAIAARAADHGLSLEQLARAVKDGVQPIEAYRARAAALGFSVEDTHTLVAVLQTELAALAAARQRKKELESAPPHRDPSVAQLEKAVKDGELTIDEYRTRLAAFGFDPADVDLLAAVLADELASANGGSGDVH